MEYGKNDLKEIIIKLVLLGEGSVGKTSLRHSYLGKEFSTSYLATLGADFAINEIEYKNWLVRYQIWDLAGQQRFNTLRKAFYIGAQGSLIIYDITNPTSLEKTYNWVTEFFDNNGKGPQPVVLIGNKIDLRDKNNISTLSPEDGKKVAQNIHKKANIPVPFIETSAKTGENIKEAFQLITDYYFKFHLKNKI